MLFKVPLLVDDIVVSLKALALSKLLSFSLPVDVTYDLYICPILKIVIQINIGLLTYYTTLILNNYDNYVTVLANRRWQ